MVDFLRQPVADGLSSVLLFGVPDKVNTPASVALQYACVCKFFVDSVRVGFSKTYKPEQSLRDHESEQDYDFLFSGGKKGGRDSRRKRGKSRHGGGEEKHLKCGM